MISEAFFYAQMIEVIFQEKTLINTNYGLPSLVYLFPIGEKYISYLNTSRI